MPERAVWWFGLLALGIALAACDGGSDAPESAAPAPESSSLFLLTRGTVVNRNDEVVASFNIDFAGIPPPHYGFVCYSMWWNAPEEVAVLIRGCGTTSWSDIRPPLPPGIALPPFDERLLMAVTTVETCSGFHEEPSAEATRIACLPNATVVEFIGIRRSGVLRGWLPRCGYQRPRPLHVAHARL